MTVIVYLSVIFHEIYIYKMLSKQEIDFKEKNIFKFMKQITMKTRQKIAPDVVIVKDLFCDYNKVKKNNTIIAEQNCSSLCS